MTTSEYRQIICMAYCERKLKGGESCKSCWINPDHQNNFMMSQDAVSLIKAGVLTNGMELLNKHAEEVLAETEALFTT